jgi:D-alanyl-lipoteichoic acid acyltransferase DltB (MBOAT superfamily)
MLFNSIEFICFFLLVTGIYYLLPHKYRWFHLLAASCWFYMAFVPVYIFILFGTIIIDYVAGILIEQSTGGKRKWLLICSLVANTGVLVVFKYYNFLIDTVNYTTGADLPFLKILLPIGLSFHTFQAMSYTIEIYRGNQSAEKHFGIYALYVMFYPQLVAGPIERPQNMLHQFHEVKRFSYENMAGGLKMMAWGMFKKVAVADRLAVYVNQVFDHHQNYDFSAYSDIALGSARTMGFELMMNFRMPYFSKSVTEFWSRWHISLSTWFRDYLYIPLGGNRITKPRTILNQFIVFLVSGLWHGANWTFMFWGFLHGLFVSAENTIRQYLPSFRLPVFLKRILVLTFVTGAWVFFRSESFHQAFAMIGSSFRHIPQQASDLISNTNLARLKFLYANLESPVLLWAVVLSALVLVLEWKQNGRSIIDYFATFSRPVRYATYFFLIYGSIVLGEFGKNQFIYFQF